MSVAGKTKDLRPKRTSVGAEVAANLREQILNGLDGEFAPGTHLTEVQTAQALEISRTTLREAFVLLTQEGILTTSPHRGTYVSEILQSDIREIFLVRRTLELRAVEEFNRASPQAVESLDRAVGQIAAAVEAGNWLEAAKADLRFHHALVASLGSPILSETYGRVESRLLLCILILDYRGHIDSDSIIAESKHHPLDAEHREFLQLMSSGRPLAARERLEHMLALSEEYLLSVFPKSGPAQDG